MNTNFFLKIETKNLQDLVTFMEFLQELLDDNTGEDKIIQNYEINFDTRNYDK